MENLKNIRRVLVVTLFLNLAVSLAKVLYGWRIRSVSMTADGFHSMFDGVSNVIGLAGIWIASKPPDRDHPYGHRKYETLATIAVSVMMFTTAATVLRNAWEGYTGGDTPTADVSSFVVMIVTLGVNLFVMTYEKRKGQEYGSDFLLADARHTGSDVMTTGAVLVSLAGVRMGWPRIDTMVALVITVMIAHMGFKVLRQASDVLVDTMNLDEELVCRIVEAVPGVQGCHAIRARGRTDQIWIDLHVLVAPETRTDHAHEIVHAVIEAIREKVPGVVDVVVHVEPVNDTRPV